METLINELDIKKKIKELANSIDEFYKDVDNLTVLVVLNGAMIFGADLIREMKTICYLDTLAVSSYVGQKSSNELTFRAEPKIKINGANILLVDDIYDTGLTASKIIEYLKANGAKSIETCCLLNKVEVEKYGNNKPKWIGFDIPNLYVIGYGLDEDEKYRNLKEIYCI